VAAKYLGLELPVLGFIPDDTSVTRAVKRQTPLCAAYPDSAAARGIDRIASAYLLEGRTQERGGLTGFLQRVRRLWK
jgi:flagellar biosynthesis protein FlhG